MYPRCHLLPLRFHVSIFAMEAATALVNIPRLHLETWSKTKRLLKNPFIQVAKNCDLSRIERRLQGKPLTGQFLVHVVQAGETLTSISKTYGVSIDAIAAANLDVFYVDLEFEGQCIYIPIGIKGHLDLKQTSCFILGRVQRLLNLQTTPEQKKFFSTALVEGHLQLAKAKEYFPALVPILAFLVTCLIQAFQHRISNAWKQQDLIKSHPPSRSRSTRWRAALYDDAEESEFKGESSILQNLSDDDEFVVPVEEISRAYTELELDYQKFLSDCGISKCGYWRGGSPE